jgi:putative ABC transport system permease protein
MFKNYFKVALRNILKHKAFSIINVTGLAIGIACCLLILLWIQDELSYDKFHENHDRIYRVTRQYFTDEGSVRWHFATTAYAIGPLLKNDFKEIVNMTRFLPMEKVLINIGEKYFEEEGIFFADKDVFDMFTFNMTGGDKTSLLDQPYTAVITGELADKYFGNAGEPIGKILTAELFDQKCNLKITGVFKKFPHNSHFHPGILISMSTFEALTPEDPWIRTWSNNHYFCYILVPGNYNINRLEAQLDDFMTRHNPKDFSKTKLVLQKLEDIHLYSNLDNELEANGDIKNIFIFLTVAIFVLLIACFNYMNLTTAKSMKRACEVGIRKVLGADRKRLMYQFLSESIIMAILGLLTSLLLVELTLPYFEAFVKKEIAFNLVQNPLLLMGVVLLVVVVGLIGGSYPAVYLSSFNPIKIFFGSRAIKPGGFSLRTVLVIAQFSISIILIVGVFIINQQLKYTKNIRLGYDKDHIVILPSSPSIRENLESTKTQLLENPGILEVCASKTVPSERILDGDNAHAIINENTFEFPIKILKIEPDFIPTYKMELAAGRNFSKQIKSDYDTAFILNEAAVKKIGWKNAREAIEKPFGFRNWRKQGKVIGVVKDLHFESLHQEITPFVMIMNPEMDVISVRIRHQDIESTLTFLRNKWSQYRPNYPFTYHFLDERFDTLYKAEQGQGVILKVFAFLAIFVACLGLFGLASFTTESRTKEIGVRKVLGASVSTIIMLLTKQYTRWVFLANLIALPIAYLAMNNWLQNFAYRISIGIDVFIFAGVLTLVIAFLTVSYQSIKTATANPVKALRYE